MYRKECFLIPNGVHIYGRLPPGETLLRFGLSPGQYILMVGRIVPEKRHLDVIKAFGVANLSGWKVVLVGGADHGNAYAEDVTAAAKEIPDVVIAGIQTGCALAELYSNAGCFVLASSHEGMPIALIEAMAYGVPVIASDIPANRQFLLGSRHFFRLGDIDGIAERLREFAREPPLTDQEPSSTVRKRYDWRNIASETLSVYKQALRGSSHSKWLRSDHIEDRGANAIEA
jgi:glycosyltransferase involved in cell wall biosynthesis